VLRLPAAVAAELRAHAERAYPEECCGILLGKTAGAESEVTEARACANTRAGARDRYAIAPEELVAAQREARARGLQIVGFYHSHPGHPARPSRADLAEAYWEGCSYVIVEVRGGKAGEIASFRPRGNADSRSLVPELVQQD
jgi:proteasome lid subunit RPN8/RPN11